MVYFGSIPKGSIEMKGKKGQFAPLIGLALVAAIMIGGGYTLGSIKGLLQFIIKNWLTMFLLVIGVSVASAFVINSYQKNPKWKKDIIGLAALLGILLLIGVVPAAKGAVQTYSAKVDTRVEFGVFGGKSIEKLKVRENSFKKQGISGLRLYRLGFWQKNFTLKGRVSCNQKKVDSFKRNYQIGRGLQKSDTITIKNLPPGGNCIVKANLYYNGKSVDDASDTFTVPRG